MTSNAKVNPRKVSERTLEWALVSLGLLGVLLSLYLTQHFFDLKLGSAGFKSLCDVSSTVNCDVVSASKWAEVLPYFPLSSAALGWFTAVFVLSLMSIAGSNRAAIHRLLVPATAFASLVSVLYLAIMLTQVKALCLFCLGIDGVNFALLGVAWTLQKTSSSVNSRSETPSSLATPLTWATLAFVLPGALFALANSKALRGFPIQEAVSSVMSGTQETLSVPPEVATLGSPNAPITIVKFSDFQCPHCQRGGIIMHTLLKRFPDIVRVAYRNYPLDSKCNPKMQGGGHAFACAAAKTAICAQNQGKFKEVYEGLFDHQSALNDEKIREIALAAGMDAATLDACLNSEQTQDILAKDMMEAERLQVRSTPTFFINGYKVEGAYPPDFWASAIQVLTAKSGRGN